MPEEILQQEQAQTELVTLALRDDFYRDGYRKVVTLLIMVIFSILFMSGISLWLVFSKPAPVSFYTDEEWRLLPPIPVNRPWIATPDLIQWVSDAIPAVFTVDFVNFSAQTAAAARYFTPEGYRKFLQAINQYANPVTLKNEKLFVNSDAAGAPFIINQGLLQGVYGWWIQMPLNLSYSSAEKGSTLPLAVQVLVTRVPTQDDLKGIRIANMIVAKGAGDQILANG